MPVLPPADVRESSPPYLFKKQDVLEKISSGLATLVRHSDLPFWTIPREHWLI